METASRVVIVGGGPTGMSAALFLSTRGVPVTVLERNTEPYSEPRAATYHPPTLELFDPSGITRQLHERGIVVRRWQFRGRREGLVAEFDLGVLASETRYPYRLQCEQHKLVQMLEAQLAGSPLVEIHRGWEVEDVQQHDRCVTLHVRTSTRERTLEAAYVVGADGGRSVVRKRSGIGFEGFTYPERFLVITTSFDFETLGYSYSNYTSDPEEWCASFKVPGDGPPGLWRVVFPADPQAAEAELLDFGAAQERLQRFIAQPRPYRIVHTNLYAVHQRVATRYRMGRVLLAGDAAHVNNPLGGMGMNFGVHDAASLAEKLARVLRGDAREELLDQYDRQRRRVAEDYLQTMTIQNKQTLEERDPGKRAERIALMRRTAADPQLARAYLLKTSMIEAFRAAAAIA
ncbi:MAG TPA: FAD-dependent oxidoreductase [Steroidobacteraceae bacterium]|nr:FAD-dependent oxidoreductase [Steroidobacteraceae bacterium]